VVVGVGGGGGGGGAVVGPVVSINQSINRATLLLPTRCSDDTPTPPPNQTHHRFGVKQREQLARNVGHPVHTLLMTATPIPRTLALVQVGCGRVVVVVIKGSATGRSMNSTPSTPFSTHLQLQQHQPPNSKAIPSPTLHTKPPSPIHNPQYGSLVLSSINEMPPGRLPIATRVVPDDVEGREQVRLGGGGGACVGGLEEEWVFGG